MKTLVNPLILDAPTNPKHSATKEYVDARAGLTVCTSTTRPAAPTASQGIYETDTNREWFYTGTAWRWVPGVGTSPYLADVYYNGPDVAFSNTVKVVPFTIENYDRAAAFDSTTAYTYKAPVTARYNLKYNLTLTMNGAGGTVYDLAPVVRVNGAENKRAGEQFVRGASVSDVYRPNGTADLQLFANDLVDMTLLTAGATLLKSGGISVTWMQIDLVGY
jgi:hypothetical protein